MTDQEPTPVTMRPVDPRALRHLPTKNPNVMEPQVYEALVHSIRTDGFLQPILIVEEDGDDVLIDGVHRSKAAVEVGLETIPAVVAPDRARAEILRIALNKMRGELDLSEIGRQMAQLLDTGFTEEELTLTGFASWEIDALLENTAEIEETDLGGADVSPPVPPKPKTYSMTIRFASESQRARLREALEALGDGNLIEGLEAALDSAAPDWRD